MTATLLLAASLSYPPVGIDLENARPEELARHNGCRVRWTFTVAAPAWDFDGVTCLGVADGRAAYVTEPTDADRGDAVTVVGVLKVVRHELPAGGWTEYVVAGAKVVR